MNFTITKEKDLAIFHLNEARADAAIAHDIKAELLIVSQEEIDVLIIDLSAVTFCDSSGLSALLLAERQMRERDGGVIIVDQTGRVKALIELAKLDGVMPVFSTIEEARAAIEED